MFRTLVAVTHLAGPGQVPLNFPLFCTRVASPMAKAPRQLTNPLKGQPARHELEFTASMAHAAVWRDGARQYAGYGHSRGRVYIADAFSATDRSSSLNLPLPLCQVVLQLLHANRLCTLSAPWSPYPILVVRAAP